MLLGGTELPALWAVFFLAALTESALRYLSWSKLEDRLEDEAARERYSRYLRETRSLSVFCLLVRVTVTVTIVALVVYSDPKRPVLALVAAGALLALSEAGARFIGRRWSAPVLWIVLPLFYWVAYPLRLLPLGRGAGQARREEPEPEVVAAAEEEIRVAIEDGTVEGALETEQKEMIEGILKFREVDVAQIMTPRTEIENAPADLPLPETLARLESYRHSRFPVCEDTLDKVVGIVYVKDLLSAARTDDARGKALRDVMREPYFVPETQTLGPLLQRFQEEHVQIAVVLDEYGGVSGLVTVEDIVEEIVGEIEDEYDQEDHENRVRVRPEGGIVADARVRVDELNEQFGLDIPEGDDYDTVGGYVTARFARVPEPGDQERADGLLIRVLQASPRQVKQVFLKRYDQEQAP